MKVIYEIYHQHTSRQTRSNPPMYVIQQPFSRGDKYCIPLLHYLRYHGRKVDVYEISNDADDANTEDRQLEEFCKTRFIKTSQLLTLDQFCRDEPQIIRDGSQISRCDNCNIYFVGKEECENCCQFMCCRCMTLGENICRMCETDPLAAHTCSYGNAAMSGIKCDRCDYVEYYCDGEGDGEHDCQCNNDGKLNYCTDCGMNVCFDCKDCRCYIDDELQGDY